MFSTFLSASFFSGHFFPVHKVFKVYLASLLMHLVIKFNLLLRASTVFSVNATCKSNFASIALIIGIHAHIYR